MIPDHLPEFRFVLDGQMEIAEFIRRYLWPGYFNIEGEYVMDDSEHTEYRDRQRRLNARAVTKYGQQAALPGGDPTREVLDYMINELVGIERYADMIDHRLAGYSVPAAIATMAYLKMTVSICSWLARTFITLKRGLYAAGLLQGDDEVLGE